MRKVVALAFVSMLMLHLSFASSFAKIYEGRIYNPKFKLLLKQKGIEVDESVKVREGISDIAPRSARTKAAKVYRKSSGWLPTDERYYSVNWTSREEVREKLNMIAFEALADKVENIYISFVPPVPKTVFWSWLDWLRMEYGAWVLQIDVPWAGDFEWIDWVGISGDDNHFSQVKLSPNYIYNATEEQTLRASLAQVVQNIASPYTNTVSVIRNVFDWIIRHVEYADTNSPTCTSELGNATTWLCHTSYWAYVNGTAVCDGYAALFSRMLYMAGVDNKEVSGLMNAHDLHAWNMVKVGNDWYHMDVTADDVGSADYYSIWFENDVSMLGSYYYWGKYLDIALKEGQLADVYNSKIREALDTMRTMEYPVSTKEFHYYLYESDYPIRCSIWAPHLCKTWLDCIKIGGQWTGNTCYLPYPAPEPIHVYCSSEHPELCENRDDCEAVGGYWEDGKCHKFTESCSPSHINGCLSPEQCEKANGFWWNGACHNIRKPLPDRRMIGMWNDMDTAPVVLDPDSGKLTSVVFHYKDPVYVAVIVADRQFEQVYWLNGDCRLGITPYVWMNAKDVVCWDVNVPIASGYVIWLVSGKSFASLDWEHDPYELYYYDYSY